MFSTTPRGLRFLTIYCMATKHEPKGTYDFPQWIPGNTIIAYFSNDIWTFYNYNTDWCVTCFLHKNSLTRSTWCFRWWPRGEGGSFRFTCCMSPYVWDCPFCEAVATPNYQNCALKCLKQGTPLTSCMCLGHMHTVVLVPWTIIHRALLVTCTFVGPRGLSLLSRTSRGLTKVGSVNLLCVAVDHGEIPHQRLTWRTHENLLQLKVEGVGGGDIHIARNFL